MMEARRAAEPVKAEPGSLARQFAVSLRKTLQRKAQQPYTALLELSIHALLFLGLGLAWFRTRPARWPQVNASCSNPTEAARVVLRTMLERDVLGAGQKADLEFVLDVLHNVDHAHVAEEAALKRLDTSADLDDNTREYIKSFMGVRKTQKTFRQVAKGVMFAIRLRGVGNKHKETILKRAKTGAVVAAGRDSFSDLEQLDDLDSYSEFDIFAFSQTTNHPLQVITVATLHHRNLLDSFNIQSKTLHSFLRGIESQYMANPYHNAVHAADVVQSTHALLLGELDPQFSELEVLTVILAAACHDVAHPGVTNQFRVGRRDEGAMIYNDISVNEMMHCSTAYQVMHAEGNDVLETLSREQETSVRKTMIDVIMATDMAHHFKSLKNFNDVVDARGREISHWDSTSVALEMVLHTADISNVTKAHEVALQWADRVLDEFFMQGDRERDLRVAISPLCDRLSVSKAKSQVGFVDFVVRPQFSALGRICDLEYAMDAMTSYTAYWKEVLEKETPAESMAKTKTEQAMRKTKTEQATRKAKTEEAENVGKTKTERP